MLLIVRNSLRLLIMMGASMEPPACQTCHGVEGDGVEVN